MPPYRAGSLEVGEECATGGSWGLTRDRRWLSAQGLLPRRVYRGALGAKRRYFAHKTNEFDPARLVAAAERQREGNSLFTRVVHVSTEALKAAYGNRPRDSFAKALAHMRSGRIESLADWLSQMQR